MITSIALVGDPNISRLTDAEIEGLFAACLSVHDFTASKPATPIFWTRIPQDQHKLPEWSN